MLSLSCLRHSSSLKAAAIKANIKNSLIINEEVQSTNLIENIIETKSMEQPIQKNYKFTVLGEPRPLSRHMFSNGRMYNPSSKYQKEFLNNCTHNLPLIPLEGPLEIDLRFYFSRPLSHYRSGKYKHILKDNMPYYHSNRKDLDNLIKFVLDSLNKHAYIDDSQIAVINSGKYYTSSEEARVEVSITLLEDVMCEGTREAEAIK